MDLIDREYRQVEGKDTVATIHRGTAETEVARQRADLKQSIHSLITVRQFAGTDGDVILIFVDRIDGEVEMHQTIASVLILEMEISYLCGRTHREDFTPIICRKLILADSHIIIGFRERVDGKVQHHGAVATVHGSTVILDVATLRSFGQGNIAPRIRKLALAKGQALFLLIRRIHRQGQDDHAVAASCRRSFKQIGAATCARLEDRVAPCVGQFALANGRLFILAVQRMNHQTKHPDTVAAVLRLSSKRIGACCVCSVNHLIIPDERHVAFAHLYGLAAAEALADVQRKIDDAVAALRGLATDDIGIGGGAHMEDGVIIGKRQPVATQVDGFVTLRRMVDSKVQRHHTVASMGARQMAHNSLRFTAFLEGRVAESIWQVIGADGRGEFAAIGRMNNQGEGGGAVAPGGIGTGIGIDSALGAHCEHLIAPHVWQLAGADLHGLL